MTRLRAGRQRNRDVIPGRGKKDVFPFSKHAYSYRLWQLPNLLFNENRGPGREVGHPFPFSAVVEDV
jgi:hypothetical protein